MSIPNNWGDWRPNLTPHTGDLQATDLIECTMIVGGIPVNTAITGAQIIAAASGGSIAWGAITGTLSAQTDLQTALNGKLNVPTGTTADYIDGTGGLQVFPTLTSADKMVTVGRNSTGSTLYAGTIIYISGSTGNRPNYVKAQANSEATSAGTFGVIQADIPNNSDGNAVTIGTLSNLDTRSVATHPFTTDTLVDGDTIYLSPTTAGYVTRVKPSAPNHLVYIGKVVRTSPTNGTIVYRIQNGYELDEIHDVAISSVANNDIIQYDSATSLWKNRSLSTAGIQPTLTSGTNIKTINSTSLLGSGDIVIGGGGLTVGTTAIASGTIGGILFQNGSNLLAQDAALFWDNTNKRLGVGATPDTATRLDVRAQGALSTDIAFRVRNSANTLNIFQVNGDASGGFNIDGKNIKFGTGSYIQTGSSNATTLFVGFGLYNCALSNNLNGSNQIAYGFNHLNIGGSLSTDGTKTLEIAVGTAPTATGPNSIKMYAAQITAYGTAAPHFRTADGNIIKLYKETTAVAAATFVVGVGTAVTDASTFDGYTLKQVVKALRNMGILA
jgi:hypothetical protein